VDHIRSACPSSPPKNACLIVGMKSAVHGRDMLRIQYVRLPLPTGGCLGQPCTTGAFSNWSWAGADRAGMKHGKAGSKAAFAHGTLRDCALHDVGARATFFPSPMMLCLAAVRASCALSRTMRADNGVLQSKTLFWQQDVGLGSRLKTGSDSSVANNGSVTLTGLPTSPLRTCAKMALQLGATGRPQQIHWQTCGTNTCLPKASGHRHLSCLVGSRPWRPPSHAEAASLAWRGAACTAARRQHRLATGHSELAAATAESRWLCQRPCTARRRLACRTAGAVAFPTAYHGQAPAMLP